MVQLTQKERMLLQDLKSQEELCVQKYQNYSTQAKDPKLQQLFSSLSQKEAQHLNTINSIISGQVPNLQQSSQQSSSQSTQQSTTQMQSSQQQSATNMKSSAQSMQSGSQQNPLQGAMSNQSDKALCQDMLSTEKHVSQTYDTAVFECVNTNIRQALNHIQKEEQEHGEQIFNYMQSNGMYTPQ